MIETYTFDIDYDLGSTPSVLLKGSSTQLINLNEEADFRKSALKVLRTLCILTQTLKNLPDFKYVTMKLYYHESAPAGYEPPGFKMCTDSVYTFDTKPLKIDLGSAQTSFHRLQARIQTSSDELVDGNGDRNVVDATQATLPSSFLYSYDIKSLKESDAFSIEPIQQDLASDTIPAGQPMDLEQNDACANEVAKIAETQRSEPQSLALSAEPGELKTERTDSMVNCLCGVNTNDLGMIFCGRCKIWVHTVCAGFFTNKDKRIPQDSDYVCLRCQHENELPRFEGFLRTLSQLRRMLSIVYNEEFECWTPLADRLGLPVRRTRTLWGKLEREGFVASIKISDANSKVNRYEYKVLKSMENKARIKRYFTLDLTKFPEYQDCFRATKPERGPLEANKSKIPVPQASAAGGCEKDTKRKDEEPIPLTQQLFGSAPKRAKVSAPISDIECSVHQ